MILVDTSAWVEFLRATGHPVHIELRDLLQAGARIVTTEPVVMELLAGTRGGAETSKLRQRLQALPLLPLHGLADFELAADLYRACRKKGATVRKLMDCLIGAVAIRAGASILHCDSDYDILSKHAGLRCHRRGSP